ncbi:MAG: flippase-like domain-containing protein [Anaerolineae bacterium]|nr:flippase-like domain-containing protein [Anaerolineae bacterium]
MTATHHRLHQLRLLLSGQRLQAIKNAVQLALAAAILFFMGRYLLARWDAIKDEDLDPNLWLLALAQLVILVGMGLQPLGSWVIVRGLGGTTSRAAVWQAFFVGQVAKYLPGGIWALPSRAYLYSQRGLPPSRSVEAIFWEVGLTVSGAVLFGVLSVPLLLDFDYWPLVAGFLGLFVIVFVAANIVLRVAWARALVARLPGGETVLRALALHLPVRTAAGIALFYVADWCVIGLGFAGLVYAFEPGLAAGHSVQLAALFAWGWAVGFLIIFTPGGIGVRDGLLAVGVASIIDDPVPLVVAVLARIAWTVAELVNVTVFSAGYAAERRAPHHDGLHGESNTRKLL